jgi:hypothetical protein
MKVTIFWDGALTSGKLWIARTRWRQLTRWLREKVIGARLWSGHPDPSSSRLAQPLVRAAKGDMYACIQRASACLCAYAWHGATCAAISMGLRMDAWAEPLTRELRQLYIGRSSIDAPSSNTRFKSDKNMISKQLQS